MVSVDDVSFPVLGIGWSAFYYGDSEMFKNVRNIIILFGVKSMGSYAFYGCDNLESIIIPSRVTSIDNNAFLSFEKMKTVYLMDSAPSSSVLSSLSKFSRSKPTLYVPTGRVYASEMVRNFFMEIKRDGI